MKIFIRIIRVILGLVLLAAFAYGLYTFAQASPKSGDIMSQLEGEVPAAAAPAAQLTPAPQSAPVQQDTPETLPADLPETTPPPVEQAPEPTPLPDTPEGRAAALGLPAPPNVDNDSWEQQLVNADNPHPEDYETEKNGYTNLTHSEKDGKT